jgi:predicted metal-dependent hydrolase
VAERPATIRENGRAKAYRPLPEAVRRAAFTKALEAYGRGDFFLAHELLEPAWMGASDPAERALHSGLIKVAAAFVHAVRGNAAGVTKNLEGARTRLRNGLAAGPAFGIDVAAVLAQVDLSLAAVECGDSPSPVAFTRTEVGVR